jgi:hypothetical protein
VSDNSAVFEKAGAVRVGGGGIMPRRVGVPPGARPKFRIAVLVAITLLAGACGRDKPNVAAGPTLSEEAVKQKCADTQWRDQNLGVWYAVCRQPVGW